MSAHDAPAGLGEADAEVGAPEPASSAEIRPAPPARHPATARTWAVLATAAGVGIALDQATKALVRSRLLPGETYGALPVVDFTRTGNEGISFGIGGARQELLIALAVAAVVAMVVHVARSGGRGTLYPLGFGLLVGGAVGNLVDRIAYGAVTDFVALPGFWIFNVADICITFGVAVLALTFLRPERPPEPAATAAAPAPETPAGAAPDADAPAAGEPSA